MSGPVKPQRTEYAEALEAYHLRLAVWLGLDPHEVTGMDEVPRAADDSVAAGMPAGLQVTWRSYNSPQDADPARGRVAAPVGMSKFGEDPMVFANGVELDWEETRRLRAEVGEKPAFPAPPGGWPASWPQPGS